MQRWLDRPSRSGFEQIGELHAKGAGDADESRDGGVRASGFDVLPVLLVETRSLGGGFLRELGFETELLDALCEPRDRGTNAGCIASRRAPGRGDAISG